MKCYYFTAHKTNNSNSSIEKVIKTNNLFIYKLYFEKVNYPSDINFNTDKIVFHGKEGLGLNTGEN